MPRRKNSPWTTLVYFLVVCGIAWAGYEFVFVRGMFKTEVKTFAPTEELDRVRGSILESFAKDGCLAEVGQVLYRAQENHYRIEIVVEDGCEDRAREMCREISDLIDGEIGRKAAVWAYASGHILVTKYLP